MKAFGWWYRNGDLVGLIIVLVCVGAAMGIGFGLAHASTHTHVYHQNYQCPFG